MLIVCNCRGKSYGFVLNVAFRTDVNDICAEFLKSYKAMGTASMRMHMKTAIQLLFGIDTGDGDDANVAFRCFFHAMLGDHIIIIVCHSSV